MPQVNKGCEFEMVVKDVFAFEDGRTVFAGEVTSGPAYIKSCDCELLIAGQSLAKFRIEEEIPLRKTNPNLRALSTIGSVDVALVQRSKDQCKLRGV